MPKQSFLVTWVVEAEADGTARLMMYVGGVGTPIGKPYASREQLTKELSATITWLTENM